jgi:hypothetical protein
MTTKIIAIANQDDRPGKLTKRGVNPPNLRWPMARDSSAIIQGSPSSSGRGKKEENIWILL